VNDIDLPRWLRTRGKARKTEPFRVSLRAFSADMSPVVKGGVAAVAATFGLPGLATRISWRVCGLMASADARDVPVPAVDRASISADAALAGWEGFLQAQVDDRGMVNYAVARTDPGLARWLAHLATTDPADASSTNLGSTDLGSRDPADADGRKAFWINTYNALVIWGVVQTYPWQDAEQARGYRVIDQPIDGLPPSKGFFQGLRFMVGGERITLDEIEKRILLRQWDGLQANERRRFERWAPPHGDPRVHFALVCAAHGCPRLQRFAYRGDRIEAQLDQVTREFLAATDKSRFDAVARVWHVSELLDWYGADFRRQGYRPRAENLFAFAAKYVSDPRLGRSLHEDPWRLEYLKYDWKLNIRGPETSN
jgi:hypothetical protein